MEFLIGHDFTNKYHYSGTRTVVVCNGPSIGTLILKGRLERPGRAPAQNVYMTDNSRPADRSEKSLFDTVAVGSDL